MARKKKIRIAIFMPRATPFYMTTFYAMQRGFEKHDVDVSGWTELLEGDMLLEFCRQYKPDVIFEMNRSRHEIPYLPKDILHVSWIVDTWGHDFNYFQESEITYFFGAHWLDKYTSKLSGVVDWLPPGFCPDNYSYSQKKAVTDFSFVGHIPLPWNKLERNRIVHSWDNSRLTFGELYDICVRRWNNTGDELAHKIIAELCGEQVFISDRIVRYDIGCRASRMINRKRLLDTVSKVSRSIRIYGPENWQQWPEFAQYYQKFVTDPQEVRDIIQTSKINLHEGNGLHFRLFDCLGAGACVFYLKNSNDEKHGGIQTFFEPGLHYVPYDENNIAEQAAYYLNNPKARLKMVRESLELVHARHTWSHRAAKILGDISAVK